jgi:glutathione peroxidase
LSTSLYDIPLHDLNGQSATLANHKGQVLLIVNVASKCGLTPQYAALEKLHKEFEGRGLRVLGFPCNDFAGQEPGNESDVAEFCELNYGVSFPMFSKVQINSGPRHPLYAHLIAKQPKATPSGDTTLHTTLEEHGLLPKAETDVTWNFEKFLVGSDGQVIGRFTPDVTPDSTQLVAAIDAALNKA